MLKTRSRSTDPLEQLLCELGPAELFVVSSLRLWMENHSGGPDAGLNWRQGFKVVGIAPEGAEAFDTLCHIMVTAAGKRADIRALFCARLGRDEARALRLLGLLQQERFEIAQTLLQHWCPPAAVRLVLVPAQVFAAALGRCRLSLPAPGNLCHALHRVRQARPAGLGLRRVTRVAPSRQRRGKRADDLRGRHDGFNTLH